MSAGRLAFEQGFYYLGGAGPVERCEAVFGGCACRRVKPLVNLYRVGEALSVYYPCRAQQFEDWCGLCARTLLRGVVIGGWVDGHSMIVFLIEMGCVLFVHQLDKLAVGVVVGLFGNDGQTAAEGFDVLGEGVDVVEQDTAFQGGNFFDRESGAGGSLFEGPAVVLPEFGEGLADMGESIAKMLFGRVLPEGVERGEGADLEIGVAVVVHPDGAAVAA